MAKKKKTKKTASRGKKRGPKAAKGKMSKKGRATAKRLMASLKTARRTTLTDYAGPRVADVETTKEAAEPPVEGTEWGGARLYKAKK